MDHKQKISVKELESKFKSKDDIYRRFTVDRKEPFILVLNNLVHYFLPSKRMCPLGFIRDIINGKKTVWKYQSSSHRHWRSQKSTLSTYLTIQNSQWSVFIQSLKELKYWWDISQIIQTKFFLKDSFSIQFWPLYFRTTLRVW